MSAKNTTRGVLKKKVENRCTKYNILRIFMMFLIKQQGQPVYALSDTPIKKLETPVLYFLRLLNTLYRSMNSFSLPTLAMSFFGEKIRL